MGRLHWKPWRGLLAARLITFREKYCAASGCRPEEFPCRLFWRCLHRHAVPLVPLITALHPDYFSPDRELISLVARTRTMKELNEEIRDFMNDTRNHRWWRMRVHVRVSTQRLRRVARPYLTTSADSP